MTDVVFHFNAPDKLAYSCRLLRKALASGAKLVVTGSADALNQLDQDLWTFSATDFVQHCGQDASASILRKTPLVLAESLQAVPHHGILVNLGDQVPDGFERFDRVIEIVAKDDEDRRWARQRWKHYAHAGLALIRHDLDLKATS